MNRIETISLGLPKDDLDFVRAYVADQNITVEQFFGRMIHNLEDSLQHPLHPTVKKIIGILPPDTDVDIARDEYLTSKYFNRESHD